MSDIGGVQPSGGQLPHEQQPSFPSGAPPNPHDPGGYPMQTWVDASGVQHAQIVQGKNIWEYQKTQQSDWQLARVGTGDPSSAPPSTPAVGKLAQAAPDPYAKAMMAAEMGIFQQMNAEQKAWEQKVEQQEQKG